MTPGRTSGSGRGEGEAELPTWWSQEGERMCPARDDSEVSFLTGGGRGAPIHMGMTWCFSGEEAVEGATSSLLWVTGAGGCANG